MAIVSSWIDLAASLVVRALRVAAGFGGETLTLAAAAGLALLCLAQPAMQITRSGRAVELDLAVTFTDAQGREIGRRGIRHEGKPSLDALPGHLVAAVLTAEDRRFRLHRGIDPVGLVRALAANTQAGGIVQGGSTITQQLAKNLFLTGDRTLERKISEAFLALWLEAQLGKDEILAQYLGRAYLGGGAFGVEAAARLYFAKPASELSLSESAMLAGMIRAPSRYGPNASPQAARARAELVLTAMLETGVVTAFEREAAGRAPPAPVATEAKPGPDHFLDWAFRQVVRLKAAGRLGRETVLTVETTLDPALQGQAEATIGGALGRDGKRLDVAEAAAVVADLDGAVKAMVGGRDYGDSQFNRAVDAKRQPGSAFKPFVYAAALAHAGLRPGSLVTDSEICIARWCPANYSRGYSGAMTLADALARSINTVAVRLSVDIGRTAGEMTTSAQARFGRARIVTLAKALGVATPLADAPSLPLGPAEVTVLDMAGAYAAFGNGGRRVEPHAVRAVRDGRGALLYERSRDEPQPRRALSPSIAADMSALLARVIEAGTGRRAAIPGHPAGGKTGTTSAYRDAWFVGFTGHLVGAVWFGNDDFTPTRGLTGGLLPAAAWSEIMRAAHRGMTPLPLGRADDERVAEDGGASPFRDVVPARGSRGFEIVSGARASFGGMR